MSRLVVLAAVALFLFTGCGADVDEDAWRADLESSGVEFNDWPAYRDVWTETCKKDDDEFSLFIAVALDGGTSIDDIRTNVRYACEDRLVEIEETQSGINDVQESCEIPAAERTEEQAQMAEAMGC